MEKGLLIIDSEVYYVTTNIFPMIKQRISQKEDGSNTFSNTDEWLPLQIINGSTKPTTLYDAFYGGKNPSEGSGSKCVYICNTKPENVVYVLNNFKLQNGLLTYESAEVHKSGFGK